MHPPEKRREVRAAFVFDGLPLKTAADRAGVGYGTALRWKQQAAEEGDDWDKARAASFMAGQSGDDLVKGLVTEFVTLHQAVLAEVEADEIPATAKVKALAMLADAFTKTMSAAGRASPAINRLAVAQDVLRRLAEYVVANAPDHAGVIAEVLEPFGEVLARAYK